MSNKVVSKFKKSLVYSSILGLSVGCNVGSSSLQSALSSQSSLDQAQTLSGSVGDGPIVGASVTLTDSANGIVSSATSDIFAHYKVSLPPETVYPVTIVATGGIDIVTGLQPAFDMVSASMSELDETVNINPFTTLIVKAASKMEGGINATNMEHATQLVLKQMGFGFDTSIMADPLLSTVNDENVANIIKTSETLGEMVRRVSNAFLLAGIIISSDQIIDALSADIVDGVIDGQGVGADPRVAAASTVVSAQVLVEALRNNIHIDGIEATGKIDSAITMVAPMATTSTDDVLITDGMISQANIAIAASQAVSSDVGLSDVAMSMDGVAVRSAAEFDLILPQESSSYFSDALNNVIQGAETEWELVNSVVRASYVGDVGTTDTVTTDTGSTSTGTTDTGSTNTGAADTGSTSTGTTDTGSTSTGTTDTGSTSTGTTDAGSTTTGTTGTGSTSTGTTDTGGTTTGTTGTGTTDPVVTEPAPAPAPVPGTLQFSAATYSVDESAGQVDITIERVGGSDGAVTVEMRTRTFNGYGTADYKSDYGTFNWTIITFADGETSKVVPVTITDDTLDEGDETFSVLLQNPTDGADLGATIQSLVTIVDDDATIKPASTTTTTTTDPVVTGAYPPETQLTFESVPNVAKPGYLASYTDPKFGTKITRVTDATAFGQSNVVNAYAKVQPWNSDGSLILIRRWVLDGSTYKIKHTINVNGETRWAHTDPNTIYNAAGGTDNRFYKINALTGEKTLLHTFTGYTRCFIGPWQGNMSWDDRYIALACKKSGETGNDASWPRHAIIYDIQNDVIVTEKSYNKNIKWISMSPSGKYVVFRWLDVSPYIQSFDKNLNPVATLVQNHAHGDLTYDANGDEVYVQYHGIGKITSYRISDGKATSQLDPNGMDNGHISCQNYQETGWCTLSVYEHTGDFPGSAEIFSLKLDGSQTVRRFAHHHSNAGRGNTAGAPEGAISPDGTKVLFTSNWGGSELNAYISEMP